MVEENKNEFVLPREYKEHENTIRVSGGSNWYGLSWCVVNKLRETKAPVDLVFMGSVPSWQCARALGAVFEDNTDNLGVTVEYIRVPVNTVNKRAVMYSVYADDYEDVRDPVKWKHMEEDLIEA